MDARSLVRLLGRAADDPEVRAELSALDPAAAVAPEEDDPGSAYCVLHHLGLELYFEEGRLHTLFFFAEGVDEATAFPGTLPAGLDLALDRPGVRRLLGTPATSLETRKMVLQREILPWDRFDWEGRQLHVSYTADGTAVRRVAVRALSGS